MPSLYAFGTLNKGGGTSGQHEAPAGVQLRPLNSNKVSNGLVNPAFGIWTNEFVVAALGSQVEWRLEVHLAALGVDALAKHCSRTQGALRAGSSQIRSGFVEA